MDDQFGTYRPNAASAWTPISDTGSRRFAELARAIDGFLKVSW
jgi:hypothetical protein